MLERSSRDVEDSFEPPVEDDDDEKVGGAGDEDGGEEEETDDEDVDVKTVEEKVDGDKTVERAVCLGFKRLLIVLVMIVIWFCASCSAEPICVRMCTNRKGEPRQKKIAGDEESEEDGGEGVECVREDSRGEGIEAVGIEEGEWLDEGQRESTAGEGTFEVGALHVRVGWDFSRNKSITLFGFVNVRPR